jgi:hypothetical protein
LLVSGHGIERFFSLSDLLPRGPFGGRVIGGVDDILTDADQAAPDRQIRKKCRVILDIGNGGGGGAQRVEIGLAAGFRSRRIGLHGGVQGERRSPPPPLRSIICDMVSKMRAVQRIVEMVRLSQRAGALHRPVVHQDRAEQSLLDIDVIGDVGDRLPVPSILSLAPPAWASNQPIGEAVGQGKMIQSPTAA